MENKMNQELTTAVEAIKTAILQSSNSSDASDELTAIIPIMDFKISGINLADFPVEDFFKVPFSHHIAIFSKVKKSSGTLLLYPSCCRRKLTGRYSSNK